MKIERTPDQLPGLIRILAIPAWNINTITPQAVTLKDDNHIYEFVAATDTLHHEAAATQTKAGDYYAHNISLFIVGRSPETANILQNLKPSKFVILLMHDDLSWKRIATPETALTFNYSYNSEKPGYEITFAGNDQQEYYPLQSPPLAALP